MTSVVSIIVDSPSNDLDLATDLVGFVPNPLRAVLGGFNPCAFIEYRPIDLATDLVEFVPNMAQAVLGGFNPRTHVEYRPIDLATDLVGFLPNLLQVILAASTLTCIVNMGQ